MSELASFKLKNRNPDVLTCIANLSNDEVFTSPEFAEGMLDTLADAWSASHNGENIWTNSSVTFLDPFTKSGVFLREIVKRLIAGLADEIPILQDRVNHVVEKQVFGIGITQLTSQLARRSVYCSKNANGEHSIGSSVFNDASGNIWYEPTQHSWVGGRTINVVMGQKHELKPKVVGRKCGYCGASESSLNRDNGLETHAYALIHTNDVVNLLAKIFGGKMEFDVVIGNPPYQLNDGGGSGTSAGPIYNRFVEQAKKLNPKFLTMVIPARWFSGGKGLDQFRDEMLKDDRIRSIHDFPDSSNVFPGVQIKGGVCFFLWNRDNRGKCVISNYDKDGLASTSTRQLLEEGSDVLIRYNEAITILEKIMKAEDAVKPHRFVLPESKKFENLVSTRRPFGDIESSITDDLKSGVKVYRVGGVSYSKRTNIQDALGLLDKWKVFIPFLASGSDSFPHPILSRPFLGEPGSATTETNLAIGPFDSEIEAKNVISYISTRLFRFLVLQRKPSQNATRKVYGFVPVQDFTKAWTDEELFHKYGISEKEIDFINAMIRPMEPKDE